MYVNWKQKQKVIVTNNIIPSDGINNNHGKTFECQTLMWCAIHISIKLQETEIQNENENDEEAQIW